nr:MAG TPA: hypothetical protein [Caudoviricetes sp.]
MYDITTSVNYLSIEKYLHKRFKQPITRQHAKLAL